jgi:hypothetical protein
VIAVPTEMLTKNGRVPSVQLSHVSATSKNDELRKAALRQLEHIRRFKLYVTAYVLTLLVLTPIWMVTQYEEADGWLEHLSTRSRYPGDWDPWILWVVLIGGAIVAFAGLRAYYFDRPPTEAEIDREVERITSRS